MIITLNISLQPSLQNTYIMYTQLYICDVSSAAAWGQRLLLIFDSWTVFNFINVTLPDVNTHTTLLKLQQGLWTRRLNPGGIQTSVLSGN